MADENLNETVAEEKPIEQTVSNEETAKSEPETPKAEQKEENKNDEENKVEAFFKKLMDTKDSTDEFEEEDIEQNRILSLFSYLGILFLIPLLATKNSKYARYHVNQGIIFLIAAIVVEVPLVLLGLIPYVGIVFSIISYFLDLVIFLYMVFGIYNAVTGKAKELPFIGRFRLIK